MARRPAIKNPFKKRLLRNELQIGVWSSLCSNVVAEILAHTEFDWICFDSEHTPNDPLHLLPQIQAVKGSQVEPIVRPPWNDLVMMKRLLDIGFRNFIVPYVQSADEARAAVEATRYPPEGVRGVAAAMRAADYGYDKGYLHAANANQCVVVQIETAQAIEALDDICRVDGIDAVFVGPGDLSASFGHLGDMNNRTVQRRIRGVAETCAKHGTTAGILAFADKDIQRYMEWGFRLIAATSDVHVLKLGAAAVTARYKAR